MKKFLALFIAGTLGVTALAACGNKDIVEESKEESLLESLEEEISEEETEEITEEETETTEELTEESSEETLETVEASEFNLSDVQPIIKEGKYEYNPYVLSKEAIENYDLGFLAFYKDFLTAYMNYETECACPSPEYAKMLPVVVDNECPFCGGEDFEYSYDYDNQRVLMDYKVDKDTLDERIRLVSEEMQSFLDLVSPDDDEADKIQTLYHAFCPLMTYDYDRAESREKISGCYAFTEHTGICVTFSNAFSQLLSQVDIDATTASGEADDGSAHVWNVACINGQNYFFDTTFELNYKEGTAFVYYGMNMDERVSSGILPDLMNISRYFVKEYVISENHLNVH